MSPAYSPAATPSTRHGCVRGSVLWSACTHVLTCANVYWQAKWLTLNRNMRHLCRHSRLPSANRLEGQEEEDEDDLENEDDMYIDRVNKEPPSRDSIMEPRTRSGTGSIDIYGTVRQFLK